MRKISKLLLLAVVALGVTFTACNNNDIDFGGDKNNPNANTHVSVALRMSQGLRSENLPDDYNYVGEWAGQDKINTVDVYLVSGEEVDHFDFEVGTDYEVETVGLDVIVRPKNTSAAIKTTVGLKDVYVVVNTTDEAKVALNKTNATDFKNAYEGVLALPNVAATPNPKTSASKVAVVSGSEDEIMMTVLSPASINVEAGITAAETVDNSAPQNRASVVVERVVARVMMTREAGDVFEVKDPEYQLIGEISNVKWVTAQGNKSFYIQRKHDWKTPNFDFAINVNANGGLDASHDDAFDYAGLYEEYAPNYGGTVVATFADYQTYKDAKDAPTIVQRSLDGKFVLPVRHTHEDAPAINDAYTGGYYKGNTPYVLVRTTFTPETIYSVKGAGDDMYENVVGTYTAGADFIVGSDGLFYTSEQAAYNATKNLRMTKYIGGKVLYYAWLNPDNVKTPYNSPVLRNHIYHIHINSFRNLGTNWNPLFPDEDPNNLTHPDDGGNPDPKPPYDPVYDKEDPDPKDPEEPNPPIDPEDPLTTKDTYMSVDVKILPWRVHSYKIDLGI